jgi:hypothetical protein
MDGLIQLTKNPPDSILRIFEKIAEAELSGDQEAKAKLKQSRLLMFTPCVIVDGKRNYASIVKFTGLVVLDFDHIDNASEFKTFLFNEYKSIVAVWLSPSKRGVKAIVKIPVVETIEEFKEYYFGIASEMDPYYGFDPSGQNAVLPLFQSYDPDLLCRDDFETWTKKGVKKNDFVQPAPSKIRRIKATDEEKKVVITIINSGFNNIVDYGHPPLRGLCFVIGGYIASGYIAETEAIELIHQRIESHPYLSKDVSGYSKTAEWAVKVGQTKPLYVRRQNHE